MKTLNIPLDDKDYKRLKKDKERKNCTWTEYLFLAEKYERQDEGYEDRNWERHKGGNE